MQPTRNLTVVDGQGVIIVNAEQKANPDQFRRHVSRVIISLAQWLSHTVAENLGPHHDAHHGLQHGSQVYTTT